MLNPEIKHEPTGVLPVGLAPGQQAYYRLKDVMRITALSRATLYRRVAERRFPAPVHLGGRACGWRADQLQEWVRDPQGYVAAVPGQETNTGAPSRPAGRSR